jgi:hypothetical protein
MTSAQNVRVLEIRLQRAPLRQLRANLRPEGEPVIRRSRFVLIEPLDPPKELVPL